MTRLSRLLTTLGLVATIGILGACHDKSASKVASEEARAGRDKELFTTGVTELQDGHYQKARLLFDTLVNTYPDSTLLPVTKIAIADSFYREGSFSAMNESEVEYKDWLQFFPKHPLADDVMMKIAEVHMRQVQAPDRDTTQAKLAERQLVKLLKDYPETDLKERAENQLWEVREILAMHDLKVARFYFTHRQAYKAAADRTKDVIEKYPGFSRTDEALYIAGVSEVEQENTERAIEHFTRLCRYYPTSEYFNDAASYLKRLDAEVPEPAPDNERPEQRGDTPGMIKRVMENISHPKLTSISKDGVLFRKEDSASQALERALNFSAEQTNENASK